MEAMKEMENALKSKLQEGQKRYRILRALAAVLVLIFSLALGAIISANSPQDPTSRGFITQAAQSLVGVAGFLAATSGAVAFFYYGKLLEFVSPSSSFMQAMRIRVKIAIETRAKKDFEASMNALASSMVLSRPLTEQEIRQGQQIVFGAAAAMVKTVFDEASKMVREMTAGPRRTAYYAASTLVALIVSAFFSTLAILTGSGQYLGSAFGFIVLGSGFLSLTWSDAHVNLTGVLTAIQAFEAMREGLGQSSPPRQG